MTTSYMDVTFILRIPIHRVEMITFQLLVEKLRFQSKVEISPFLVKIDHNEFSVLQPSLRRRKNTPQGRKWHKPEI